MIENKQKLINKKL